MPFSNNIHAKREVKLSAVAVLMHYDMLLSEFCSWQKHGSNLMSGKDSTTAVDNVTVRAQKLVQVLETLSCDITTLTASDIIIPKDQFTESITSTDKTGSEIRAHVVLPPMLRLVTHTLNKLLSDLSFLLTISSSLPCSLGILLQEVLPRCVCSLMAFGMPHGTLEPSQID